MTGEQLLVEEPIEECIGIHCIQSLSKVSQWWVMGSMFDDRLSTIAMDFSVLLFSFFQVLATQVNLRNHDMWANSSRDEIKQKCHEIESIISLSLKTHHNFLSKVLPWVIGHQAMPYPAHNKYSKSKTSSTHSQYIQIEIWNTNTNDQNYLPSNNLAGILGLFVPLFLVLSFLFIVPPILKVFFASHPKGFFLPPILKVFFLPPILKVTLTTF